MQEITQMKTTKQLPSIWTVLSFGIWRQKRSLENQKEDPLTVYRLYSDCSDLPLENFKDCLCFDKYEALIIEGNPPISVIQDKWLSIYSEFIMLSHETDVIQLKSLQAAEIVLVARINKVHLCVNSLFVLGAEWDVYENDEDMLDTYNICVETLRKLGFRYKFDPRGKTYYEDLKMVLSRTGTWELHLELKQSEIAVIQAKNTGGSVSTSYFSVNLTRISMHYRFSPVLSMKSIMTAEYCTLKRDYTSEVNKLNIQNARKR